MLIVYVLINDIVIYCMIMYLLILKILKSEWKVQYGPSATQNVFMKEDKGDEKLSPPGFS